MASGASADVTLDMAKSYWVLGIQTDRQARVRLYLTAAARTADANRPVSTDPTSDAGVVLDYVTGGTGYYSLSPLAGGYNNDSPATTTVYASVTNYGSTGTVTLTLNWLKAE